MLVRHNHDGHDLWITTELIHIEQAKGDYVPKAWVAAFRTGPEPGVLSPENYPREGESANNGIRNRKGSARRRLQAGKDRIDGKTGSM